MQHAATRSPGCTAAPSGALRTIPATSLPGTNGSGGLNWYSPRVCSTSGNDTPAAWTSMTTPLPGVSMCDAEGSSASTSSRALSGPVSCVIWMARIGRARLLLRRPRRVGKLGKQPADEEPPLPPDVDSVAPDPLGRPRGQRHGQPPPARVVVRPRLDRQPEDLPVERVD